MGPDHPRSKNQGRRVRSHAIPTMIDRRRLLALAAAAPVLALGRTVAAQAPSPGWPNRFVKLVVPFTPGGGIDGIGRILGVRLSEMWAQQVVIENKPGAARNIASEFVARSAPDGYTIYITAAGLAVSLPLCLDQLRPACRFRSGDADLSLPQHVGGAEFLAAAFRQRPPRVGQDESGESHLCLARARQLTAYERRAVQISGQSRSDPPALPRGIAGLYRRDRGPRRLHVRGHGLGSSARSIRTVARARRDHGCAGGGGAGGSDHRRGWRARLRHVVVVRF